MKAKTYQPKLRLRQLALAGGLIILSIVSVKIWADSNSKFNCSGQNCSTGQITLAPKEFKQVELICQNPTTPYIYRDYIQLNSDNQTTGPRATCTVTAYSGTPSYTVLCSNSDIKNSHQVSINWTCSVRKGPVPFKKGIID